jgi:hypothetical protein
VSNTTATVPAMARVGGLAADRRRPLVSGVLVLAAFASTWLLSGVSAWEAARFIGYELVYTLAPGCLLYLLLSPVSGGWLRTVAIGWPCGYALEVGWFALTATLHIRWAFALLPVAVVLASAPFLYRRARHLRRLAGPGLGSRTADGSGGGPALAVAVAVGAAVVLLSFTFFAPAPLPADAHSVVYGVDNVFDISLAAEARHHWPITEPWVAGEPLHYYTGSFIHIAAINQATGVPLSTVVFRLLPSVLFLVTALQLWWLGRSFGRSRWTGPVAVALLLGVEDLNLDPTHIEVFHVNPFNQFPLSPSFAFAVPFFLGLLALVRSRLLDRGDGSESVDSGGRVAGRGGALGMLALLLLGCAATKTFAAADFIGGLGLFWLWRVLEGRPSRRLLLCLALSVLCLGVVYLLMIRGGTSSTLVFEPLNFVRSGNTLARAKTALQSVMGHSALWILPLVLATPFIAVCVFAPLLGVLWLFRDRHGISPFGRFLMCIFVVGLGGYVLLGAPGGVEGVFLVYGYIALVPLAALGLVKLWSDTPARLRRTVARACGAVLAVGIAMAGTLELVSATGRVRDAWYALAYGIVAAALVVALVRNMRLYAPSVPSQSARVVACAIPLVGVLGLVKPSMLTAVGAWKTVSHKQISVRDSRSDYGITAALYQGLVWVRGHTSACDVLAVNNHTTAITPTPSAYFYYSAIAERRVFLESWYYTPNGARLAQPFPRRFALNNEAVSQGDPAALRKLAEAGVSYVLIDKLHGGGPQEPPGVSRLVFANRALEVYRLAPPGGARRLQEDCS